MDPWEKELQTMLETMPHPNPVCGTHASRQPIKAMLLAMSKTVAMSGARQKDLFAKDH